MSFARWRVLDSFLFGSLLASGLFLSGCAKTPAATQPVPFNHRQHTEKKLKCTFCHSGAEKYGEASIPGVAFCMSCHSVIRSDTPDVLRVKAYLDRKEEIPWRRVYRFDPEADVFFDHRRHAAAGIECGVCHGRVEASSVLTVEVRHTMGTCLKCHRANRSRFRRPSLADDCATCHR